MIGSLLNEKKADIDKDLANLLADNGSRNIRLRGRVLYEGCLCYRMYPYIFPYP